MIRDLVRRLRLVLPAGWFADTAPNLDALLTGLAAAWALMFTLLDSARSQTRLATMSDVFLDLTSTDWFGTRLARRVSEPDDGFRSRLSIALTRSRATRQAVIDAVTTLTGVPPRIFEPARPADTGAWGIAVGWGLAGAWGSLSLPYQCFVITQPSQNQGAASVAGYGTGGGSAYTNLAITAGRATDQDIFASVSDALPAGTVAWVQIEN